MGTLSVDKLVKTSAGAAEFILPATDGTAGQVMQTDGSGQLSVATVPTTGIADDAVTGAKIAMGSDAAGDVLYYNGTDYVRLGAGTASQTLKMNSGATAPEWVTVGNNTPSFRADMSANQSITANVKTKVSFDTERWDTNSAYDPTTNYRFTVPSGEAGKYYFGGFLRFDGVDMQNIQWQYKVTANTTTGSRASVFTQSFGTGGNSADNFGVASYPYIADLIVGDYVEVYCFSQAGTSLTVKANSGDYYQCSSWFGFKLIG